MAAPLTWRGHFYNTPILTIYDIWVLHLNMPYAWGAQTSTVLLPLFRSAFAQSRRHLDIGVATGYFPSRGLSHTRAHAHARAVSKREEESNKMEITLMDIAPNSLSLAAQRIERENPGAARITTIQADALGPAPDALRGRFDSVSMFNLVHCIPGTQEAKARVFGLAKDVLSDEGVLVGCTVLGWRYLGWRVLGWLSLGLFNLVGAFSNWGEGREAYEQALRREFEEVETWVCGSMLLWRGSRPRRDN
ncbi:hypothetical protein OQA88_10932 [Cercophora sp. LCS_1]